MGKKLTLIILIILTISLFFIYYKFNLSYYLSFESLKYHRLLIKEWLHNSKWQFMLIFFICYSLSCLFVIPLFYLVLNIVAGFAFGIIYGMILVSIINAYTTIITFIAARCLFRNLIENKFHKLIVQVNNQFNRNGLLYIFFIRAFPITPFVVSNSIMGLTRIKLWVYLIIGQLSILPELILTLYVGKNLDNINNIKDILNIKNYLILLGIISIFVIIYLILNRKFNKSNTIDKKLPQ